MRRNQRGANRRRESWTTALRKTLGSHFRRQAIYYLPALAPTALFVLAHLAGLVLFALMHSGILNPEQMMHKAVLTWAVFGFLPLLFGSYLCFFAVARPVGPLLTARFPDWTAGELLLASGGVYGLAIGLSLILLRPPESLIHALLLLGISLATGIGNWFFYRKVITVDA